MQSAETGMKALHPSKRFHGCIYLAKAALADSRDKECVTVLRKTGLQRVCAGQRLRVPTHLLKVSQSADFKLGGGLQSRFH